MADTPAGATIAVLGSYGPSLVNFRGPLIAELVGRGYRVVALAAGIDGGLDRELRRLGAEVREVAIRHGTVNPLALLSGYRAMRSALREIAPATVIAYTIQPVTIGALAAAQARVPRFVALVEGLGYAFGSGGGLKQTVIRLGASLLYRVGLARSNVVIFLNADDLSDLRSLRLLPADKRTAVVDGCGVDLQQFAPCGYPAAPTFIMIARLTRSKGVLDYARAAAVLKRRHPAVRFRLAGWIDESRDAISPADLDRMIADGVDYVGKLADVRPQLAEASVFVLPSRYREGVPRSALEAMAMGRAVVTYDGPGCRETVVDGSNGYLVPAGDVGRLTDAMERFIVEPALIPAMGRESRAMAERRFDVHAVNRAIVEAAGL